MKKIELLAPAGGFEALRAAVENGADAVYLGGSMFSARQYANNFGPEELKAAVDYAHSRAVKIHVAVNTLVANQEIGELIDYLYQLAEAEIDALIVQDLGAAKLIRNALPKMELHASTQMAIHNSAGVRFLEEMGFSRAVLAREVSLNEIKKIKDNSSLDLETFVHGALCVAYSGQCLMSSLIGGRSGNRGRCAQPCRMKYFLVDEKGQALSTQGIGDHLLSPKDLKMIEFLPDLIGAGISSLKVEGRMKRPEYVATVIRNYREMIDSYYEHAQNFRVSKQSQQELEQIFNRDFTTGYYFGHQYQDLMSYKRPNNRGLFLGRITKVFPGRIRIKLTEPLAIGDGYEVWVTKGGRLGGKIKEIKYRDQAIDQAQSGQEIEITVGLGEPRVGDRVFKTNDAALMQKARESFLSPKILNKTSLEISMKIVEGKVIELKAEDAEGYSAHLKGNFLVEKAQKYPISKDLLWKQMSRLGNTPFKLVKLDLAIDDQLMVPVSELNFLRRQLVESLLLARKEKLQKIPPIPREYKRGINYILSRLPVSKSTSKQILLSVLVGGPQALRAAIDHGADQVYLNWEGLKNRENFSWKGLQESLSYCQSKGVKAVLRLPTFVSEEQSNKNREFLLKIKKMPFDGFLISNLGYLQLARELGLDNLYADYTLNIFNDLSIYALDEMKIKHYTLSPELTLEQIKGFKYLAEMPMEVIVHGNFPLMISEYCAVGSVLGGRNNQKHCGNACLGAEFGLKDRMDYVFPLAFDESCRMLIYNAKPLNLIKDIESILTSGIGSIRIEGRHQNAHWIKEVTKVYRQSIDDWRNNPGSFRLQPENIQKLEQFEPHGSTTGHFFRGVI